MDTETAAGVKGTTVGPPTYVLVPAEKFALSNEQVYLFATC